MTTVRPWMAAAALGLTVTLAGCGGGASEDEVQDAVAKALASQQAASPAPPASAVTEAPSPAAPSPAAPEPEDTVDFVMPDMRGKNLQDAQNEIQRLGVFFSISHDMLGSRSQLLDSNWQVCDQTPAAGTRITGPASDWEGKIDFGAVKLEETCP